MHGYDLVWVIRTRYKFPFGTNMLKRKSIKIYIHLHDVPYGEDMETVWNVLLKEGPNLYGT